MSPFTRFVSRKVLGAVAGFALVALVATAIAGYLVAHGSPTAASSSATDPSSQSVQAAFDTALSGASVADPASAGAGTAGAPDPAARAQLRADLRAAFRLQGDARRSALSAVRARALSGGYGPAIQRRAERRDIRHDLLVSLLPADLQQDLQNLKNAPADQRQQLRTEILDKAVAGDYGPEVQKAAERLKALRQG